MRIGIVTGEYPPMQGGVGAYSRILAMTMAQQGHQIFVFSSQQAREDHPRISLTNNIQSWNLPVLRQIRRWAQTYRLNVVNLQFETVAYGMSPWIHFLPDFLRHIPVVTTFHDLLFPYLLPKAGPLRDWIVMRLAKSSTGVIATNHEDMLRLNHLPCSKLIPIGSNVLNTLPGDFDRIACRRKVGASPDDFLLAYFGFINRSKGVDILLESVVVIKDSCPVKLVMIGGRTGSSDPSNAAYADEIDALIAELDLQNNIHRTGFVDDESVSAYLAAADAVVLPFRDGASYRRGSLMAAIQHGCAIITTAPRVDIPLFVHEQNMLLAPPELIKDKILQLYHDRELCQRLRDGAKGLARHFDWEIIAQDCVDFFSSLSGIKNDAG
jgi:glycosyltransferase involved in cell wall biosynthesis